jgi:hypothetical protein
VSRGPLGLKILEAGHEPFTLNFEYKHLPLHLLTLYFFCPVLIDDYLHAIAPRLVVLGKCRVRIR